MELPPLSDRIQKFKTDLRYKDTKASYFVPSTQEQEFWEVLYRTLAKSELFQGPVQDIASHINPYFGYFGARWNPSARTVGGFHTGLDIEGNKKTPVHPIANGILEYSGYGVINGNYIMLSHPDIASTDGFVLYSLYMHLRDVAVRFSSYQKMLHEISLHSYPQIPITKDMQIGTMGDSGQSRYPKGYVHMHLQLEFRHKDGRILHIDPAQVLGLVNATNMTAQLATEKEFMDTYVRNRKDIYKRKLEAVWKGEAKEEAEQV